MVYFITRPVNVRLDNYRLPISSLFCSTGCTLATAYTSGAARNIAVHIVRAIEAGARAQAAVTRESQCAQAAVTQLPLSRDQS